MKNKAKKQSREQMQNLLRRGLIAGLSVVFAVNLILLAKEITEEKTAFSSESYRWKLADSLDFPRLSYELTDELWGIEAEEEKRFQYGLLQEYYRQSVMYDACIMAVQTEEAERRNTAKQQLKPQTDETMAGAADRLDRLLSGLHF